MLLFFRDIELRKPIQDEIKQLQAPARNTKINHTRNRAMRWQVGCVFNDHWLLANQSKKRLVKSCKEAQS
jgi:ABC-type ATPase involved in cell division